MYHSSQVKLIFIMKYFFQLGSTCALIASR